MKKQGRRGGIREDSFIYINYTINELLRMFDKIYKKLTKVKTGK